MCPRPTYIHAETSISNTQSGHLLPQAEQIHAGRVKHVQLNQLTHQIIKQKMILKSLI